MLSQLLTKNLAIYPQIAFFVGHIITDFLVFV